jgi:hypothetical protein
MSYNLATIRQLIEKGLTKNEFEDLLFDNFRSVSDETDGQELPERRRKLVDYADKHREIPKLLEAIKKCNPTVYQEFDGQLTEPEPGNDETGSSQPSSSLSSPLKELIQVLTPIDFNTTVVKAYRDSLPELRRRPTPDNLEALVRLIADIPGQPDELKPLWRFVKSLIQDKSLDSDCQRAIEAWAKVQKIPLDLATETVQSKSETGETYLMIKVKFHPPDKYIVSAAIVEDPDPLKLEVKRKETSINIPILPDPKYSPGYSQEQLPLILSELIAICGGKYSIPLTDLVVQWFLPIELMSLPIEHWQISIGRQKPCNGERCKAVIVRSSERHFSSDYQSVLGEWQEHWKHLLDRINLQSNKALEPLDPMTGKAKIEWSQTNAVGCTFIEHDDLQQQIEFWDNLLGQGLPIALWSRQPVTNKRKTKRIMKSVTESSLAALQISLTKQRINALPNTSATTITSQPAAQLALLWDNPFRRFPDIQYESH